MRIHWAIVVITALGVSLLTWHLRTRDINFLTPKGAELPPEDFGTDLAAGSASLQPPIVQGPKPDNPIVPVVEEPEIPEITEADLGDLESSPGLDTYREFARKNDPTRLSLLSSTLQTRGEFQRALLALERIIDSGKATPEELIETALGIAALTPTLPKWNIDPTSEVQLTLEIGIPRALDDAIKDATLELATLIRKHSGNQIDVIPKVNSTESDVPVENPSIALWFSTTGDQPISSAVLTMKPSGDQSELLNELSLAVFQTIRSHLEKEGYAPPPPLEATGQDLLTLQITRLMWRDFARSLYRKPAEPEAPPENPSEDGN
ncbi:hypothetical protein V2O64_23300 [Verrucomicrobiaceae bacterium 227]